MKGLDSLQRTSNEIRLVKPADGCMVKSAVWLVSVHVRVVCWNIWKLNVFFLSRTAKCSLGECLIMKSNRGRNEVDVFDGGRLLTVSVKVLIEIGRNQYHDVT